MKLERAIEMLKPLLEDPSVLKIGQNIKYDIDVLARYGIAVAPIECTMLISFVLDAGLHGHGLDELAKLHLDHDTIKYKDVAGSGKTQIGFAAVALDKARDYAAEDADFTLRLHRCAQAARSSPGGSSPSTRPSSAAVPVIVAHGSAGIKVDSSELQRLSEDFAARMAELEIEIHKLAGHPFNIASPQQLGKVLFDRMSLARRQEGQDRRLWDRRRRARGTRGPGHDLPARVLDWRQLPKLKSTYADALMEQINPETGRVHTSIRHGGRVHRPALLDRSQSPEHPGAHRGGPQASAAPSSPRRACKLVSPDYSQIELRLAAHVADIAALKRAFKDGIDIHAATASEVFGVPVKGMDPKLRRSAKAINFGIVYGISAFRPRAPARHSPGRGGRIHQGLFRALPRHPRLHGAHQGALPQARLCRNHLRPAHLSPRHQGPQPVAARLLRARRHQRAVPGRGRRHHQARHEPRTRRARCRPALSAPPAPGP